MTRKFCITLTQFHIKTSSTLGFLNLHIRNEEILEKNANLSFDEKETFLQSKIFKNR